MPEISPSKYLVTASWQEVPHLDTRTKKELLDSVPPFLRDARSKGIPSMGAGAIYPIPEEEISVPYFDIPIFWPRAYALDVGWNKTAALWIAWNPVDGVGYAYAEHYRGQADPSVHAAAIKARGEWICGVCDPAAKSGSQRDGEKLLDVYRSLGLKLELADNQVDAGLHATWVQLSTGRLKIMSHLQNFFAEYRLYRRDENGRVVKKHDHLADCGDEETEVLTKEGWRLFKEVNEQDELATVNLDTDEIEYQHPTELIARPHDGDMVFIEGRRINGAFTPNHRMVVYQRGYDEPDFLLAHALSIWDRVKLTATWKGEQRGTVRVEGPNGKEAEIDADVWAELLGWYVAEGWAARTIQMPGRGYQVGISQRKTANVEYLAHLLSLTPWRWRWGNNNFTTSCKWLWNQLAPLGKQPERFVPQWVKDSELGIIETFISAAVAGDGWTQNGVRSFATTSKRLADDMQELFLKIGHSANVRAVQPKPMTMRGQTYQTREQYWLTEAKTKAGLLRDSRNKPNFSTRHYRGMVYCATVPNGTLIVRRNGKPMVVGNCLRYAVMSGRQVAKTSEQEAYYSPVDAVDSRIGY